LLAQTIAWTAADARQRRRDCAGRRPSLCDAGAVAIALAIFASGAGSTAQAVIDACASGRIDGEVVLIVANNAAAQVLERAAAAEIPWRHLSARTHPDPQALEQAMIEELAHAGATHVLLAGYMKKLAPAVVEAYAGRIYNTHPALLPAYGGRGMYGDRVHAAVLADGQTRSGATVHLVTDEYDSGPIVGQVEVVVAPGDDVGSLGERVRAAERELVVEVLCGASPPLAPQSRFIDTDDDVVFDPATDPGNAEVLETMKEFGIREDDAEG
jgi:phosphoribosylglycinamide formyltransferase 1